MLVEIEPLIEKAKAIAGTTPFAVPLIIRELEKAKEEAERNCNEETE